MNISTQRGRAGPWLLWMLVGIVVIVIGVLAYLYFGPGPTDFSRGKRVPLAAYHPVAAASGGIVDPTGVPAELRSASLIERGQYLTQAADCAACHTTEDGAPFSGGRAFVLPFGTIYSSNITPDLETGIGSYSDEYFLNAVRKGIGRNHTRLYPAMPYASYTAISDDDALAIKAYLFSLKPVHAPTPPNTLAFPFSERRLMAIWSVLFNSDERFEPDLERSAQWNRGAYLTEALGHCGDCHTPRNVLFALDNRRKFAGDVQAGWRAYNITADRDSGIGAWSDAQLAQYLSTGHAQGRGTASGPMGEAVDASLSHLKADDIAAMVVYLRSVPALKSPDLPEPRATPAPDSPAEGVAAGLEPRGKAVYEGACAGCHGWSGVSPVIAPATLIGVRAVNDPTAINVVQVILTGAHRRLAHDAHSMPPFGGAYSDQEIAGVANYVTARFGAQGSALNAARVAQLRAAD